MSKHFNYQLHINGQPQAHYARMTPAEADRANETQARYGMAWENPQPVQSTPFGVANVDGTRERYPSFAAFNQHLRNGGMAADRRRAVAYIKSQTTVRRAA